MWNIGLRTPRSVLVTVLVALVVVIAALAVVVAMRPRPEAPANTAAPNIAPQSTPACGKVACQTVKSVQIHGTTVTLLDDGQGGSGVLTVGADQSTLDEVTITALGAKLD